jgi:subtilase family serine protease
MNFKSFFRIAFIALTLNPHSVFAEASTAIAGHLPLKHLAKATDLGESNLVSKLELAVSLAPRDPAALAQFLTQIYDPTDPLYHHFITPAEFTERFAPTQTEIDEVTNYLASLGFEIVNQHANRMIVDVRAPQSRVQNAFKIQFRDYLSKDGRIAHSPTSNPMVPDSIGAKVNAIVGLHDFTYRLHHSRPGVVSPHASGGISSYMTPSRINSVYNVSATGQDGTGESIALFELDGYTTTDITAYASYFSLPNPNLQNVLVDGATGTASTGAKSGAGEVTLDIELALAIAPKSKIMVYEGPLQGSIPNLSPDKEILDIYAKIANDNFAKTVSTSWGATESESDSATLTAENTIFAQMAAQGQSFFAAAGDSGAYDDSPNGGNTVLAVDDPASQPYATGVGGTTLTWNGAAYGSESSWKSVAASGTFGSSTYRSSEGGGGGISNQWSQPSYQTGFGNATNKGSSTNRMVPDVSLDADPASGYPIYYAGGWQLFGGTSCAAPMWAAFTALVNERRVAGASARVGFINPTLYALAGSAAYATSFHDIADGSTNLFYPAKVGYDLTTGLGSFNGAGLFSALTASAGAIPTPTPSLVIPGVPSHLIAEVIQ